MANGHISDDYADILVAAFLTRDLTSVPTSYFVGVTLELPSDNNGTGLVAPDDPNYGRFEIVAEADSWTSMGVGSRSMESAVEVLFEPASVDWGEIKGYTLYDSLVDGLFLGYGITNPHIISSGMQARFSAGLIVIAMPV